MREKKTWRGGSWPTLARVGDALNGAGEATLSSLPTTLTGPCSLPGTSAENSFSSVLYYNSIIDPPRRTLVFTPPPGFLRMNCV